jgi:hypothetical protein
MMKNHPEEQQSRSGRTSNRPVTHLLVLALACIAVGLSPWAQGQGNDLVVLGTRLYNRLEFKVSADGFVTDQRANIAVLTTGNFIVSWHEDNPTDCYGRAYNQNGVPLYGPFLVSDTPLWDYDYGPSPAPLPNGRIVVVWGGPDPRCNFGQIFESDFVPNGAGFELTPTYNC